MVESTPHYAFNQYQIFAKSQAVGVLWRFQLLLQEVVEQRVHRVLRQRLS